MGLHSHPALDEVVLQGNRLTILNETLHITRDCIPGHLDGLFYSLPVGDASWKGRDQDGVAAFWFPSKSDSITKSPHSWCKLQMMKYNLRLSSHEALGVTASREVAKKP